MRISHLAGANWRSVGLLLLWLSLRGLLTAQSAPAEQMGDSLTIFDHSADSRYWISGQINVIFQAHPAFPAKYSGENSLHADAEHATSRVMTLFMGWRFNSTTALLVDLESAGGRGISDALGLAGFTNLDVVRNPDLGAKPYLARWMIHKIIPLSERTIEIDRNALSMFKKLPARRLEIRAGKFSLVDFFDLNSVGSDSHLQFMNWTIDNNGAYDYAANTRGYTDGALVEYDDRQWTVRFAETLMPKVANGINLEANLQHAHAENLEFEIRKGLIPHRSGTLRVLSYVNHGNMGNYRQAVDAFLAGKTPRPDIQAHPRQVRVKYGLGINLDQKLTDTLSVFGRFGWNDGHNESFAYTEVDQTLSFGWILRGDRWKRHSDHFGVAFVANAISGDHRRYLALGGRGFLLGDGALTYGREQIVETFYTAHLWRGLFLGPGLQHVVNPGYNRDRGPVLVPTLRFHVDF
ncbi:MAG: carbohydrate porin [Acidobacteriia bacterium]|nr:carbohydrate porin [Terriglobia bacterium]